MHSFNTTLYAVELLNHDMEVTEREVFLAFLPLGLNWGYITLLQSILAGATLVLMERFNPRAALELIQNERVSYIPTAPAGLVGLLNAPGAETFDVSSLRVVITGGASAAVETIRDYQKRMKGHLIELYGMLEAGFQTYTRFTDDPQKVNGTIGRPVRAMELRIVDAEGNDVPSGEIGELMSRGPSIHLGYHNNPSANAAGVQQARAGSAPAISAGWSMPTAMCRSPAAARRSSTAAARSSSRARSRRSSIPIRASCMRR